MSQIADGWRLRLPRAGCGIRPGRGKLLSGLPGAAPAHVVIFGAGTVAVNACDIALGMGARVTVIARNLDQLRAIEERSMHRVVTLNSTPASIGKAIEGADVLISGVLVKGGQAAPKLVSRQDLKRMGAGAVIVDVAIDQGGIFETSRPTTHSDPVFVEEGVVHYCVANMPGAVPHTAISRHRGDAALCSKAGAATHKALSSDPASRG
jgi:alanine dehydrogenase